jgi:hypothetical protein
MVDPSGLAGKDCVILNDDFSVAKDYNPDVQDAILNVCRRVQNKNDNVDWYGHPIRCVFKCSVQFWLGQPDKNPYSRQFFGVFGVAARSLACMSRWCPAPDEKTKRMSKSNKYNCDLEETTVSCKMANAAAFAKEGILWQGGSDANITYCKAGLERADLDLVTAHELLHLCVPLGTSPKNPDDHQKAFNTFAKCLMGCPPL